MGSSCGSFRQGFVERTVRFGCSVALFRGTILSMLSDRLDPLRTYPNLQAVTAKILEAPLAVETLY